MHITILTAIAVTHVITVKTANVAMQVITVITGMQLSQSSQ